MALLSFVVICVLSVRRRLSDLLVEDDGKAMGVSVGFVCIFNYQLLSPVRFSVSILCAS